MAFLEIGKFYQHLLKKTYLKKFLDQTYNSMSISIIQNANVTSEVLLQTMDATKMMAAAHVKEMLSTEIVTNVQKNIMDYLKVTP